jgi:hypothetical protein
VIFCTTQDKREVLTEQGIRRITFLFYKERGFPKFFTFRAKSNVRRKIYHPLTKDSPWAMHP